jgi:hypothetical protein
VCRRAACKTAREPAGVRNSKCLAAKDTGRFVDATTKASQLKALQKNILASCSKPVQSYVAKKQLLKKTKKPIEGADLVKLSDAVGLGAAAAQALDRVLAIGAAVGKELHYASPFYVSGSAFIRPGLSSCFSFILYRLLVSHLLNLVVNAVVSLARPVPRRWTAPKLSAWICTSVGWVTQ